MPQTGRRRPFLPRGTPLGVLLDGAWRPGVVEARGRRGIYWADCWVVRLEGPAVPLLLVVWRGDEGRAWRRAPKAQA